MLKRTGLDSLAVKKDSINLKYNFNHFQSGGLFLKNPADMEIIFDKTLDKYVIVEKIGDYYVKTPIFMSPSAYQEVSFTARYVRLF